jgi:hypothetical protein
MTTPSLSFGLLDPLTLSADIRLENTLPHVGKVWVIGRHPGEGKKGADFFHAFHKRVFFTPLLNHAKGFNDLRILGAYSRFIADQLGSSPLFLFYRPANPAEIIERAPLWHAYRHNVSGKAVALAGGRFEEL